jgi:hypothetical protein
VVGIPGLKVVVLAVVGIRVGCTAVRMAVVPVEGIDAAAARLAGADLPVGRAGDSFRHHRLHLEPDLGGF